LLSLIAAGLSLIFGLMNVVSMAHGSFFILGAFFGLSIFKITGSFWLALILAPIPVVVLGVLMELLFLRPLYRRAHLDQVLLVFLPADVVVGGVVAVRFPFCFPGPGETCGGRGGPAPAGAAVAAGHGAD